MSVFAGSGRAKEGTESSLREDMRGPVRQLKEAARRIAKVSQESNIDLDPKEYEDKFSLELVEVAYAWAKVRREDAFSLRFRPNQPPQTRCSLSVLCQQTLLHICAQLCTHVQKCAKMIKRVQKKRAKVCKTEQ